MKKITKVIWVYVAIAFIVAITAFIHINFIETPLSLRRAIDKDIARGGTTVTTSAPNTVVYCIGKGVFWPYSLGERVVSEHTSLIDWFLNRYDPWEGQF